MSAAIASSLTPSDAPRASAPTRPRSAPKKDDDRAAPEESFASRLPAEKQKAEKPRSPEPPARPAGRAKDAPPATEEAGEPSPDCVAVPVAGEAAAATAAGIIVPETTPETDAETGEAGPPTETGSPDATTTPFAEPQAALVAAPSPGGATATPLPAGDGGELRSLPPLALRGPHGRAGEANAATQVPTKDAPDGAPRTAIGPAGDAASGRDGAPAHAALIADREDAASGSAAGAASDRGVLPPLASPTPAHAPAAEAARAVAPQVIPPTPVQMTPLVIGLKAMEGAREFSIRLQPEDLGRVDVTLSIKDDGRVGASLVADRVETLALLQRDARTLERAFDQAGLTADQGAIRFSLRQDNASGQQAGQGESGAAPAPPARAAETDPAAAPRPAIWRGRAGLSGVDILV